MLKYFQEEDWFPCPGESFGLQMKKGSEIWPMKSKPKEKGGISYHMEIPPFDIAIF